MSNHANTPSVLPEYENHFALRAKAKGCSTTLLGNVCLVTFFVNEEMSAWHSQEIKCCKDALKEIQTILQDQSQLSQNRFQVSYALDVVSVQLNFDRDAHNKLETNVLQQYGDYDNSAAYQKHYEEKFQKDEAPVVFVLNRDFRSFAFSSEKKTPSESETSSNEASFVSFCDNAKSFVRTYIHELLHQFGAIDLYLPEKVKEVADKHLPNSIMNGGDQIDPLTRYLIGWDEVPQAAAIQFLEETKDITADDIKDAYEKDADNDW